MILWSDLCGWRLTEYHALEIVFTRQKSRVDANPESPPRTHHKIDIHEVQTPSWTIFTQEQNELFVQKVVQDALVLEGEVLHYRVIGFNWSSTEDDLKKPIIKWLFNITLTKISIHRLLLIIA